MDARLRVTALVAAVLFLTPAPGQAARLVFTTSSWGTADLSTWPDAAQLNATGLDAADAICQAHATAAGLSEPETYVAWLSDRDHDAVCRLLGHGGKLADNCGEVVLPQQAGPWTRTDGMPFAESLADLLDGKVLSPLLRDESGARIQGVYESFAATSPDGTFNEIFGDMPDCEQWTNGTIDGFPLSYAATGSATGTTASWTDTQGGVSCDGTRRLICMQGGTDAPLPPRPVAGRLLAFVTQADQDGNTAGVVGADAICKAAAADGELAEAASFKALLTSSGDTPAVADRFNSNGPWYRPDGMLFVATRDELVSGEVTTPLNVTEFGEYVGYAHAYTGAEVDGSASGLDCGAWTSTVGTASASVVNEVFFGPSVTGKWLSTSQVGCAPDGEVSRKLYCLADIETLFADGFEP